MFCVDEQKFILKYFWLLQSILQQVGEEPEHKEENEKTEPPENSRFFTRVSENRAADQDDVP